jgi:hypothetical protein
MNRIAALFVVSIFSLALFTGSVLAYERWSELSREDQLNRAVIYTMVNAHAGREVVVHPAYGFEIPLSLALMSDQNG